MAIWLTLLGMALATLATRVITMLALRGEIALWLQRWLGFVPVAVFVALLLPPLVFAPGDAPTLALGPALPAGVAGAVAAWRTGNVLATIGTGLVVFWLLRWAGM
jgi:branched-subunit amino acid transport protein